MTRHESLLHESSAGSKYQDPPNTIKLLMICLREARKWHRRPPAMHCMPVPESSRHGPFSSVFQGCKSSPLAGRLLYAASERAVRPVLWVDGSAICLPAERQEAAPVLHAEHMPAGPKAGDVISTQEIKGWLGIPPCKHGTPRIGTGIPLGHRP